MQIFVHTQHTAVGSLPLQSPHSNPNKQGLYRCQHECSGRQNRIGISANVIIKTATLCRSGKVTSR